MISQAQITVGAKHQNLLAVDDDFAVLRRGDCAEVGVKPKARTCAALLKFLTLSKSASGSGPFFAASGV